MNLSEKKRAEAIRNRIRRLADAHKTALSAIALRSGVEQGTVKALYEQDGFTKRTIAASTACKLERGLDSLERELGLVKKCSSCGRELTYGHFHADRDSPDGVIGVCKECRKAARKSSKERKRMNNNTETAITAEIVMRVKAEDKRDVESKFMAPYFGITPKHLDEIRKGVWDKLLLTPKAPKRAESVLEAVEALRGEVAMLRREVEAVLVEMGVEGIMENGKVI